MSLGLELILSTALVAVPAACSWAHPGANPYRGDPVRVLADFALPAGTREKLRAAMTAHRTSDVVTITRDNIVGTHEYTDLREMHSGQGRVCHGAVDRSAWSATRRERGLVYCADDACVIVPTICNNVSLVTRRPEREAGADDEPIDIAPAAGPPAAPTETPASVASETQPPGDFLVPLAGTGEAPGGGVGGGAPVDVWPVSGSPNLGIPIGGGGVACCDTTPVGAVGPVPPISPVPEPPAALALFAGLVALGLSRMRRAKGKPARERP